MVISAGAEYGGGLRFGILGSLEVTRLGEPVAVGGPKRRALLAMLLLHPREVMSSERLSEDLWDGKQPRQARATLQSHVSHLRRDLGTQCDLVVSRVPGYLLDVDPLAIDAWQFEHTLSTALDQRSPSGRAVGLREALGIWRGPPLAEFTSAHWARPEITRLEARRELAVESLAQADLDLGRHAAVLADLEHLVSIEPFREVRWVLLMTALQRAGRHVDAIRAAHRYRLILREAGLNPSPIFERAELAAIQNEQIEAPSLSVRPAQSGAVEAVKVWQVAENDEPHSPPLVGRRGELARLKTALAAAREEHPSLILVSGEPGAGKSRLIDEIVELAHTDQVTVLVGHCDDALAVPYQPFVEALQAQLRLERSSPSLKDTRFGDRPEYLSQLVPDILQVLPQLGRPARQNPDIERYHLFESVYSWLAKLADEQCVLLVIEDMHWATRPTLLLVRHVLRSLRTERLCIVATVRETDIDPRSDGESLLIDITQHSKSSVLTLQGLNESEITEMIGHVWDSGGDRPANLVGELPSYLLSATAGNPFFLLEIVRHLAETYESATIPRPELGECLPLPQSLHDVVRQRLRRLASSTEDVLARAAVIGREFSVRMLLEMSSGDGALVADSLEQATRAGFIKQVPGADLMYQFSHTIVRDALLARLPEVRKALLHREAGLALESIASYLDADTVVELATRFTAAAPVGEAARAVSYSRRAGDQALERHAAEEAVVHYSTALSHLRDAGGDEYDRCDLLTDLAEAQRRVPDPVHRETFLEAARLARNLGNQDYLARAAMGLGRGYLLADAIDEERIEVIESAVASYGDSINANRARLLASHAGELRLAGRHEASEAMMEEAATMARLVGDVTTMTITQLMQWDLVWRPSTFMARKEMEARLVSYSAKVDDSLLRARIAAVSVVFALEAGRGDIAQERLGKLERHAKAAGGPYLAWLVPLVRSVVTVATGRLEDAERHAKLAVERSQADTRPGVETAVLGQLVLLSHLRGQIATWEEIIASASDRLPVARALLALVFAETGRVDEASMALDRMFTEDDLLLPRDMTWPAGVMALAGVCERLGAKRHAAHLFDLLAPCSDQFLACWFYFLGPVAHMLGSLSVAMHDFDAAERWYSEAERRCAVLPSPWFRDQARAARSRLQKHSSFVTSGR